MELYTKEELDELKKIIKEIDENDQFKDTLESIDNCIKLIDSDENKEN